MQKKLIILIIILVLAAAGGILYYQLSNAFNKDNLQGVEILLVKEDNVEDWGERSILSPKEKEELFIALTTSKEEKNISQEILYHYEMIIYNKWGFSREYAVLFSDSKVFLQDHLGKVFEVKNRDFFYSYPAFVDIYSQRLMPKIEVTLNSDPIPFTTIDKEWSYQRYDGQWAEQKFISPKEEVAYDQVNLSSLQDKFAVGVVKKPDYSSLQIIESSSKKVVYEGEEVDLNKLPFPDRNGNFSYQLTLKWSAEDTPYRGRITVHISVKADFPEKFVFGQEKLVQGDVLEVYLYYASEVEDIYFEQSLYHDFRWYQGDGFMRGYLPTNYNTKPGKYSIEYGNKQKGTEFSQEIEVIAYDYQIQHLKIDPEIEKETRSVAAYEEYNKYFTPVRKESAPTRYYTEPFIIPVKGRLTTEFGQTRYVNGEPTSYRHSGLDIAAPTGREIKAANRGKVVLARNLMLTGNTIVIDHGEGLFSVYYHAHQIFTTTGEIVERGQKIATVGTTGFSTGPHLHFTMSHYTTNIEPGFFLVGQPITYANYAKFLF